jgi:hypothetical protein
MTDQSLRQARAALGTAKTYTQLQSARAAMQREIGAFLGNNPTSDAGRLDARYPIALFPVRIETRFDQQSSSIKIRVYPDEILADAHDPSLTSDEQQLGARFWSESASIGAASAWQHLVCASTAPRAAWIVIATDPSATTPPVIRTQTWARAVDAPLLPDRWVAIAYRGGTEIARAWSSPVIEPLALTVDPSAPTNGNVDISGGLGLMLDPAVVWTVDYTQAVAAGMAFALPLSPTDYQAGCDRLLVFGIKGSLDPASTAAAVTDLFNAQHYSRGWAFVPQGTPTNDSRGSPSGFPPADPNGSVSFGIERGASLATAGGDGALWVQAFGLSSDVVAHVGGADRTEQQSAAAMTRALFGATWGYFLDTMMAPAVSPATVDAVREYMVGVVRARGPLAAFRVGNVPYGVLPVGSLTRWPSNHEGLGAKLPNLLRTARSIWSAQINAAPHVGRSADTDGDLLDVMSMDASARAIRLRRVLGQSAQWNLLTFFGIEWAGWANAEQAIAQAVLAAAGLPGLDARVLSAVFADTAPRFRFGFVSDKPVSETTSLDPNYITWLRTATIGDIQTQALPSIPDPLLYRLLRYALLTETWRVGKGILLANSVASAADLEEHELVGIVPGTEARLTPWGHFAQPVPAVTHTMPLGEYLSPVQPGEPFRLLPPPLLSLRSALQTLEPLSSAELERLTTETLDLAANRLDAWITSLFTTQLGVLREAQPTGLYAGAFAWVENLKPEPARTSPGGYIHGPSMTHAAAAAVLRNGFLTSNPAYAVNLTSARVRAARCVLDAVREGQALGAVFGYQVERQLHELETEILIEPLRALYPLVANKVDSSGFPADRVAARNVVDGLQLRSAWTAATIPWGSSGIPASGSERTTLETVLKALDDTADALADLLLAESVYQIVRGTTDGASATLDSMAQGVRPPDPEIANPLRGGTDLTHRVVIVLGGDPLVMPSGWAAAPTPRAAAEPRLDAWVGTLLGDPSDAHCRVSYPDPTAADPNHVTTKVVTLDALLLRPLDFLALSAAVRAPGQVSELDRRIVFAALGDTALPAGPATVDYTRDPSWDRKTVRIVPEVLETAQAAARLIGGARPMAPQDLVRPADASPATGMGLSVADAEARAAAAVSALNGAATVLSTAVAAIPANTPPTPAQLAALRTALRAASLVGASAAYPVPGSGLDAGGVDTTVLAQATSALAQLTTRQAQATAAQLPPIPPPTDAQRVAAAGAVVRAVIGRDFVFLAGCTPPPASNMAAALAASAALIGDPHAPIQWLQGATRVRAPLGRWRTLRLLSEANGAASPSLAVVQLPVVAGARWGALPFTSDADRVDGRLSLVLDQAAAPAATAPWYGLVVDEWVELIPNVTESTGLAMQYPNPGAEAAQTVLLAVATPGAKQWDLDTLIDTLNETADLAKMRAVDASQLGVVGQLLPAIYFTANNNDDTISVKWADAFRAETTISAAVAIT